jgi:hypothetical protein
MIKRIQKKVTIPASGEYGNNWDFSTKVKEARGRIRAVMCLTDLSSLRDKIKFTLKDPGDFAVIDEVDLFSFTSSFDHVHDLDVPAENMTYKLVNSDTSERVVNILFEIEYQI